VSVIKQAILVVVFVVINMRKISQKNKNIINTNVYYKKCHRAEEGTCEGRITIDHALIFAGRQIDELWNFVPTCAYHHAVDQYQDGGDFDKQKQIKAALLRATEEELLPYCKCINYIELKKKYEKEI